MPSLSEIQQLTKRIKRARSKIKEWVDKRDQLIAELPAVKEGAPCENCVNFVDNTYAEDCLGCRWYYADIFEQK